MTASPKRSKNHDIRLSETQMRHPGMEIGPEGTPDPSADTDELEDQYQYVVKDLTRIGIIAVVMLGVLVALALLV